ncbi:MAG: insulinase family protein, partial [Alistipes sp.]|nr:insulinase family protein [Alistipes sp.]
MIPYRKKILANGLTVVANRDRTSKLAAVNMLYKVGARNENPARTGFAHLFEHLMFRGTKAVPDFDLPVQMASGDNNAFTNNDYTDFYITLPTANIETALWLESDRMGGLNITSEKLETEKKVVIEEYRQRYLNQPYGDQTLLLRALTYKVHPYRWAAIGLTPDHIAEATLADVETFYRAHYHPSNAILSISADLDEERMIDLAEKWFGELPDRPSTPAPIPQEPPQTEARRQEVERDVPATTVTVAYPMGGRTSADFYTADLVSDLLSGGDSSRLYNRLVKERRLLSSVNAYITGDADPGLFIFTGQLLPETTPEAAEAAFREEIGTLCRECIPDYEMQKVKNKFEANTLFGELNVMNKAMNLGFYEMLGDLGLINREVEAYRAVTNDAVADFCHRTFRPGSQDLVCRLLLEKKKGGGGGGGGGGG